MLRLFGKQNKTSSKKSFSAQTDLYICQEIDFEGGCDFGEGSKLKDERRWGEVAFVGIRLWLHFNTFRRLMRGLDACQTQLTRTFFNMLSCFWFVDFESLSFFWIIGRIKGITGGDYSMLGLNGIEWMMLIIAAIIIGFSKTGIQGATIPAVALVAIIFGGKASAGIMLPMLMLGDLIAIFQYGKQGKFSDVLKLLPAAVIGIVIGAVTGNFLDDRQFKALLGVVVLVCLGLLVYREVAKRVLALPKNRIFHWMVGAVSGFSSMVGNAAGPIFNVYLLSQDISKNKMIGTTAWFFLLMNVVKLPFHIFMWGTVTWGTIRYMLLMIPFIAFGSWMGITFVRKINELWYKRIIMAMTGIAAIRLFI